MDIFNADPASITYKQVERIEPQFFVDMEKRAFQATYQLGYGAATRVIDAREVFKQRLQRIARDTRLEGPAGGAEYQRWHLDTARLYVQAAQFYNAVAACVTGPTAEWTDWTKVAEPPMPAEIGKSERPAYEEPEVIRFDLASWFDERRERLTDEANVRVEGVEHVGHRKLSVRPGAFNAEEAAVLIGYETALGDLIAPAARRFVEVRPTRFAALLGDPVAGAPIRATLIAAIAGEEPAAAA